MGISMETISEEDVKVDRDVTNIDKDTYIDILFEVYRKLDEIDKKIDYICKKIESKK